MDRELILHIGTHKTGTTSIQRFLRDELGEPAYPAGLSFMPGCHSELVALSGREQLLPRPGTPARTQWLSAENQARMRREILARTGSDLPRIVYSFEGLSLLREGAEFERLFGLFAGRQVHAVLYLREPQAFLRSYARALQRWGVPPSQDPDSPYYLGDDSWLTDHAPRMRLWEQYAERLTVLDYDEEMRLHGSVLPSFSAILGIAPSREYFLNRSSDIDEIFRQKIASRENEGDTLPASGGAA